MKIYLARHAEAMHNVRKIANADPTIASPLSPKGIAQAKNLSDLLRTADFEVIFVSAMPRTRQTADIINAHHHKPIVIDDNLHENRSGYEGKPIVDYLAALQRHEDIWTVRLNDGESLADAAQRARDFIDWLREKPYKSVLVVTHGFIIESIFGYLENKSFDEASEFNIPQGTFAEFEI